MRLLLIEDRVEDVEALKTALDDEGLTPAIDVAASRDAVQELLASRSYDVIVCDLRIPTGDGELDSDVAHGLAALGHAQRVSPGTPVIVLSAHGTVDVVGDLMSAVTIDDPFGAREEFRMLSYVQKRRLDECVEQLAACSNGIEALRAIEVSDGATPINLTTEHRQLIRIFARRHNGAVAKVWSLKGGLSGARVLRVRVEDGHGGFKSLVVAKLSSIARIADEADRYAQYVASALPHSSFTALADQVRSGAGDQGGLFYTLLDGYTENLFEVLRESPGPAAVAVGRLRERLARWLEGTTTSAVAVAQIRQLLISDEALSALPAYLDNRGLWDRAEAVTVQARGTDAHGDLHGENVLLNDAGGPVIIDFGSATRAVASLDPITLELSAILHPEAPPPGEWLTSERARSWPDIQAFADDSPWRAYLQACRDWAVDAAAGYNEVCAVAYAYAMRQLQYNNPTAPVALAVAESAAQALLSEN